jgi:hypothetical protein
MSRGRKVGWTLSLLMLFATGALGLFNGLRELAYTLTPLQRSVSIGVLVYGMFVATSGLGACRQLYSGPPVVRERDDWITKRVRAKREPDRLIAEDLSVCWVIPEIFARIEAGDAWRCDWRHLPTGQ